MREPAAGLIQAGHMQDWKEMGILPESPFLRLADVVAVYVVDRLCVKFRPAVFPIPGKFAYVRKRT
jgi:hypothetical protein